MKVLVYPADEHGCGHHRLIYPVGVLREQDPDLDVLIVPPKDRQLSLVVKGTEVIDVRLPDGVDVVVFQRPTDWRLASAIRLLRSKCVTVVVDVDDDLAAIHPANPAWTFLDPNRAKHEMDPLRGRIRPEVIADMEAKKTSEYSHSWHNLADACKHASLVTVSTPGLLRRYAAHGRGHVLDNYVADGYLAVPHVDSDLLGWPAALHSHPNDPAVLGPALHRLVGEGARFVTWGQDYPADVLSRRAADAFGLREPVELRTDVGIFEWPGSIAELGVGIAPLADTRFNQSKSRLKILELSAVGVPWVASPRTEYAKFHRLGVGLLADKPRAWYSSIKRLLDSPALREEMSLAGRDVARACSLSVNAWRFWEAWQRAYHLDREKSTVG